MFRANDYEDPIIKSEVAAEEAAELAAVGYEATPEPERMLLHVLSGFLIGGAMSRIIAIGIRDGWWPVKNVYVKNRHIHHFIPGIIISNISAMAALLSASPKKSFFAFSFGVGAGMTLDEAALLLDLKDVYWTEEGLLSIQLSLGAASVLASTVIAMRIISRGENILSQEEAIMSLNMYQDGFGTN